MELLANWLMSRTEVLAVRGSKHKNSLIFVVFSFCFYFFDSVSSLTVNLGLD